MNMRMIFPLVLLLAWVCGCSSISVPSMPWSHANKADPTAEALYDEGMRNFNDKRYVRALDSFSKLRTDYPFSPQFSYKGFKDAGAFYLIPTRRQGNIAAN